MALSCDRQIVENFEYLEHPEDATSNSGKQQQQQSNKNCLPLIYTKQKIQINLGLSCIKSWILDFFRESRLSALKILYKQKILKKPTRNSRLEIVVVFPTVWRKKEMRRAHTPKKNDIFIERNAVQTHTQTKKTRYPRKPEITSIA